MHIAFYDEVFTILINKGYMVNINIKGFIAPFTVGTLFTLPACQNTFGLATIADSVFSHEALITLPAMARSKSFFNRSICIDY